MDFWAKLGKCSDAKALVCPGLFCYSGKAADQTIDPLIAHSFTKPVLARIWHIAEVVALFAVGRCEL